MGGEGEVEGRGAGKQHAVVQKNKMKISNPAKSKTIIGHK